MSINSVTKFLDESKFNRFHLSLLIWCVLIVTMEGYNLAIFGSIIPSIMKDWHLSPTQVGVIGSYGLFGMMAGSIFLSTLADRFGHKKLLIISVVLYSLFITISSFSPNVQVFAWCRLIGGIGFGGALPTIISLLSEYAPKTSKSKAITIALSGYQVGGILAPLLGILLISTFGWRSVIWFAAIPLILLPFIIKGIPESPKFLIKKGNVDRLGSTLAKINPNYKDILTQGINDEQPSRVEENVSKIPIFGLFKNKLASSTILFCIMFFMGLLVINLLITWLPNLIVNAGYSLSSGLLITIFLNAGTIIGTVIWGIVADKKGLSKKMLVVLYILGAISLALMGIKGNILFLYLLIAATGFFLFSAHSLLSAFVSNHYPEDVRSTAIGFGTGFGQLGGVLAPTMGGIIFSSHLSTSTSFISFAIPGILAAIALVFIRKLKHNKALSQSKKTNQQTELGNAYE